MTDPTAIPLKVDPREQRMKGTAVHGNTPFDVPYISEVGFNLWMGGCTDGLVIPPNIRHVVSLYPWESYRAQPDQVQSMLSVRMYDANDRPDAKQVRQIAMWVNYCRERGPTLVDCQAGLNRSGLIVASAILLYGNREDPRKVIALLREKRSPAVLCNPAFEQWLLDGCLFRDKW